LALTATVPVSFLLFTKPSLESNGSKKGISPIMDRCYSESLKLQKKKNDPSNRIPLL
jgi:hypothetical protein